MTWAQIFKRLFYVLRVRFTTQHMCDECGDVLSKMFDYKKERSYWGCVLCEEEKALKLALMPKAVPGSLAATNGWSGVTIHNNTLYPVNCAGVTISNCSFEGGGGQEIYLTANNFTESFKTIYGQMLNEQYDREFDKVFGRIW